MKTRYLFIASYWLPEFLMPGFIDKKKLLIFYDMNCLLFILSENSRTHVTSQGLSSFQPEQENK